MTFNLRLLLSAICLAGAGCALDNPTPAKKTQGEELATPTVPRAPITALARAEKVQSPLAETWLDHLRTGAWAPADRIQSALQEGVFASSQPASEINFRMPARPSALQQKLLSQAQKFPTEGGRLFFLALAQNPIFMREQDPEGRTLLHWLVQDDRTDLIQVFLAIGEKSGLSQSDEQGRFPVHYARSAQMLAALGKELITTHDDRNFETLIPAYRARDLENKTPLHLAAKAGWDDAVSWYVGSFCRAPFSLLSQVNDSWYGNLMNDRDTTQRTPLHYAAISENAGALKALALCESTDLEAIDHFGRTPLQYAVAHRDPTMTLVLLKAADKRKLPLQLGHQDDRRETALHIAIRCLNAGAEKALTDRQSPVNLYDRSGRLPIDPPWSTTCD